MPVHITIVEDDEDIAALVAYNLERQGWKCTLVHHGTEGWEQIRSSLPDCVILDMMLPGMDGYQVCTEIRKTSRVPIIMLTAKGETFDKVLGLELGADDYVTKPFNPLELIARVKSQLRRYTKLGNKAAVNENLYQTGGLVINDDLKELINLIKQNKNKLNRRNLNEEKFKRFDFFTG